MEASGIGQVLEAERDEHLGYRRYERTDPPKTNARMTTDFWLTNEITRFADTVGEFDEG